MKRSLLAALLCVSGTTSFLAVPGGIAHQDDGARSRTNATFPPGEAAADRTALVGRFVHADGTPVVGGAVALLTDPIESALRLGLAELAFGDPSPAVGTTPLRSTTNERGEFRFEGIAAGSVHALELRPDGASRIVIGIGAAPDASGHIDLGERKLAATTTVPGRLVDAATGTPIAAADVIATTTETPFPELDLERLASGSALLFASEDDPIVWQPPTWLCERFAAGGSLSSDVTTFRTKSAQDGSFRVVVPTDEDSWTVLSIASSVLPLAQTRLQGTDRSRPDGLGTLRVDAGTRAKLRVVDTQGKPMSGAEVRIGHAASRIEAGKEANLVFDLRLGGPLSGTVREQDTGKPLSDAHVVILARVASDPGGRGERRYSEAMDADDDGGFATNGHVPSGGYWMRVRAPGRVTATVPIEIEAGRPLDLGTIALGVGPLVEGVLVMPVIPAACRLLFDPVDPPDDPPPLDYLFEIGSLTLCVTPKPSTGRFKTTELAPGRYIVNLAVGRASQDDPEVEYRPIEIDVPREGLRALKLAFETR